MSEQDAQAKPDEESDTGRVDSLQLILSYARESYLQQFATLDTYRARAGSLLAFAAVLVTLSAAAAPRVDRSLAQAGGTGFVMLSAILLLLVSLGKGLQAAPSRRTLARSDLAAPAHTTEQRLLRDTPDVVGSNQRILTRLGTVLSIGLLCLVVGTIIIGVRVAVLLP